MSDRQMQVRVLPSFRQRLFEFRRDCTDLLSRWTPVYLSVLRAYLALIRDNVKRPDFLVGNQTEVVIEGYPRCANWFAVTAFEMAQKHPVRIAHHLHVAANLVGGVRRGIPCLAVIRDPDRAVPSFVVSRPHVTLRQGYREYVGFYRRLVPHREHLVVASFEQVTQDFGGVIRRMNQAFGTNYAEFEHAPENVEACFQRMEEVNLRKFQAGQVLEASVSRPSETRKELIEKVRKLLDHAALREPRRKARAIYEEFLAYAGAARS